MPRASHDLGTLKPIGCAAAGQGDLMVALQLNCSYETASGAVHTDPSPTDSPADLRFRVHRRPPRCGSGP